MTTDTTALQERIERALAVTMECEGTMIDVPEGDVIWCMTHNDCIGRGEWCRYVARAAAAVLPVIAAEMQAAKAEAWSEGYSQGVEDEITSQDFDGGMTRPNRNNPDHETGDRA